MAAEGEVVRIERHYSRYRADSELSRINSVAACGGSVDIEAETAALMDYAKARYVKSGGVFDITSGLLRAAWDFSRARLPDQVAILRKRIILSKDLLVSKTPSAHLLNQQQTAVKIIPGRS